jgi:purine nucleosidase
MAAPEALKLQALTTVAGNVPLAKTSRNARLACEWAGRPDTPVYAGAERPLQRAPIYAANIHGREGITGVEVHEPATPLAEGHAVDYLIRTLRAAPEKSVTLAMLGPQTNLALALAQAPTSCAACANWCSWPVRISTAATSRRPPSSMYLPIRMRRRPC